MGTQRTTQLSPVVREGFLQVMPGPKLMDWWELAKQKGRGKLSVEQWDLGPEVGDSGMGTGLAGEGGEERSIWRAMTY